MILISVFGLGVGAFAGVGPGFAGQEVASSALLASGGAHGKD